MNPNYVAIIKLDLDKFLNVGLITVMEEANWLLPIVIVLKKNSKVRICLDF
jgi:hypothetical protein